MRFKLGMLNRKLYSDNFRGGVVDEYFLGFAVPFIHIGK